MLKRLSFAPLMLAVFLGPAVWAADTTPPTTPVVTDDGVYMTTSSKIHATWTSSDPESGIALYQYLIRQDSTAGPIIVNWTSTGTTAEVTKTGLSLVQGKSYYVGVKARNGANLWSAVGYSNGIKVDTTAPSVPGMPTEGSPDADYDGDGAYAIYWAAASDPESGLIAYQLQEQVVPSGAWTTLSSTLTSGKLSVSGRTHNTRYRYQVRAKNGAGVWSAWSPVSDGILVDTTAPGAVVVSDDGSTTASTTSLHATWTAASDPESGVAAYQYQIRQTAPSGPLIRDWTSAGLATEVTATGLSLMAGQSYVIGVRAQNAAGAFSAAAYSDGITVQAATPTAAITSPTQNQTFLTDAPLTITGTASDANLLSFTLEYGPGASPSSFENLTTGTVSVVNGTLYAPFQVQGLAPGTYTFRLTVTNQTGAVTTVNRQVVFDHIQVSGVSASPDQADPYAGQNIGINYSISRAANVTVRLYHSVSKQLVRTLTAAGQAAGPQTLLWDGKNGSSVVAPIEAYYFTVTAVDTGNPSRQGSYNDATTPLLNVPPSIFEPVVSVESFNPYQNGRVQIDYVLDAPARVRLTVLDQLGAVVRTLINQQVIDVGGQTALWDGRRDDGSIHAGPFGLLFDRPDALPLNACRLIHAVAGLTDIQTNAYLIQPVFGEVSQISYSLPAAATVSVAITDPNGNAVRTLLANVAQPAGAHTVEWDGRTDAGPLVTVEGDYAVTVTVVDPVSGLAASGVGSIMVYR